MHLPILVSRATVCALFLLVPVTLSSVAAAQAVVPATPAKGEVEVLTKGPIHEAFAQPVVLDP